MCAPRRRGLKATAPAFKPALCAACCWIAEALRRTYTLVVMNAGDHFDPRARAAEKQASREADEAALASGEKSRDDLRRENGAFALLRVRPDFAAAHARR